MVDVTLALVEGARGAGARRAIPDGRAAGLHWRPAVDPGVGVKIGVVKEIKPQEARVALTPAGARELVARGHDVVVETGAGEGSGFPDEAYVSAGASLAACDDVWASSELLLKVKEPLAGRVPAAATRARALHLPAPGAGAGADAGADRLGRDLRRLRDGGDRRPPPAAARADERGRGPARAADGRARAREGARRPGRAAGRRRRRAAGQGRGARRRHRRLQRRADRGRHAGRRLGARPLDRPHARARPDARRPRDGGDVEHAAGRGGDQRGRSRDRRRARARRARAEARDARHARPHEAGLGARRRRDRPGRLLRDLAPDDALGARPTRSTASSTTASRTCPARCR